MRVHGWAVWSALLAALALVLLLRESGGPPPPVEASSSEPPADLHPENAAPERDLVEAAGRRQESLQEEEHAGARSDPVPVLTGRVVDGRMQPVAGASVKLYSATVPEQERWGDSDAEGRFEFEPAPGAYVLHASHAEAGAARRSVRMAHADRVDVGEVVLRPVSRLSARLAYPDGQPVAGLEVTAARARGEDSSETTLGAQRATARTDRGGGVRFLCLEPGTYRLELPTLLFGDMPEPEIELSTGESEEQVVVDLHRLMVPGVAELGLHGWREEKTERLLLVRQGRGSWRELREDFDVYGTGTWTGHLVPRGSWWWVYAERDGRRGEALLQAERSRNETTVELDFREVEPSAVLRLRLRDARGRAPGEVEVETFDALDFGVPDGLESTGRDEGDFLYRASPGRFFLSLQPEPDRLRRSDFFPVEREVVLRAGEETLVEAHMARCGRVGLTVHLPEGMEVGRIPGLEVTADGPPGQEPNRLALYQWQRAPDAWVSGLGVPPATPFVCLRPLAPGRHEITVTADGFAPQRVGVLVEAGEVTRTEVWLQPR